MTHLSALAAFTAAAVTFGAGMAAALPVDGADGDITPYIIFGGGNANGGFTGVRDGALELGLRAKLRYNSNGAAENTFNYDGDKTYTFDPAASNPATGRSIWNFEWAINSDRDGAGGVLDAYSYQISVSGPGFTAITYDPLAALSASNLSTGVWFGDSTTPENPGNTFTPVATGCNPGPCVLSDQSIFDGLAATSTIAQNSVNLAFLGLSPTQAQAMGIFNVTLKAFGDDGQGGLTEVASTEIHVNVVPVPAALPLLGVGLAGLGLIGRYKRRRAARA